MKIEEKASNALTDTGVKFTVGEHEFAINGLKLATLIEISALSSGLSDLNNETTIPGLIGTMQSDALLKAKIIATAINNSKPVTEKKKMFQFKKRKSFYPSQATIEELTKYLLQELDSEQTKQLTNIIISQIGTDAFFLSTASLKGINLLKKKNDQDTSLLTQSGEE